MASKRVKAINATYRQRHGRKTSKGAGIYALQPPGTGPNATHVRAKAGDAPCRCGGCSNPTTTRED